MTAPTWTNSEQGDLLELVALGTPQGDADMEWERFVVALDDLRRDTDGDLIYPNDLRPMLRHRIAPKRIAAFTSRAIARNLIAPTGDWQVSDDREGRNAGRPARIYRWIGDPA